ncbi:hypothetical protein ACWD64_32680 [Streptomyces antibioticus]
MDTAAEFLCYRRCTLGERAIAFLSSKRSPAITKAVMKAVMNAMTKVIIPAA